MKTPEEQNTIKEEVDTLSKKLADLSEKELKQVSGGSNQECRRDCEDRDLLCPLRIYALCPYGYTNS